MPIGDANHLKRFSSIWWTGSRRSGYIKWFVREPHITKLQCFELSLTTDTEEKTMLNKVVVFAIFGPKRIFDASKNSNWPSDVTWTTLMMFFLPFLDMDSIPYTQLQWRDRGDKWRSHGFGTTWGWVINGWTNFWVNYPFNEGGYMRVQTRVLPLHHLPTSFDDVELWGALAVVRVII